MFRSNFIFLQAIKTYKRYETFNNIISSWMGIVLQSHHTRAEPYALAGVWTSHNQSSPTWGRSIKSPLIVDLIDHTLTLPSKVIGYTLTLESEDGEVYTYYIYGVTFEIPQELSGEYSLTILGKNEMYQGTILL